MNDTFQQPTTPVTEPEPKPQPVSQLLPIPERRQQVGRASNEVYRKSPDWVTFFREVLGVDGIVRQMFPNPSDLLAFEQSIEFTEIQQMMAKLRERSKHQSESNEPTRVITVRLPKSLHESLRAEAHQKRTSMNQLCISKLLQIIGNELVPAD
jgi:predicted HicB family RNase H-like nuclease